MGTPHPKALRAASQEAWPDTGQTLGNVAQGSVLSEQYRRNIRKVPRGIDSYLAMSGRYHGKGPGPPSSHVQRGSSSTSGCLVAIRIRPRSCSANITSRRMFPRSWVPAAPRRFVPHRVRDTKALGQQPVAVPRTLRSAERCAAEPGPTPWIRHSSPEAT
jgi:hypothetical protein